eukprot:scaffold124253_cov42-Cyclotella_meneghiniana.AAC.2
MEEASIMLTCVFIVLRLEGEVRLNSLLPSSGGSTDISEGDRERDRRGPASPPNSTDGLTVEEVVTAAAVLNSSLLFLRWNEAAMSTAS